MRDYGVTYKSVPLMCDSSSAICLAQNPIFHWRPKHIKVRYHFLRDHVEKGDIEMKYIDTERQLTDIFTKPLEARVGDLVQRIRDGHAQVRYSVTERLRGRVTLCAIYIVYKEMRSVGFLVQPQNQG
jgi:hypothetical protein